MFNGGRAAADSNQDRPSEKQYKDIREGNIATNHGISGMKMSAKRA